MIPRPSALARVSRLSPEKPPPVIPRPSAVARVAHFWKENPSPVCLRPSAVARVAHLTKEKLRPVIPRPSAPAPVAQLSPNKPPPVIPRPSAIARVAHFQKEKPPPVFPQPSGVLDLDSCRQSASPRATPDLVTNLDRAPKSSRPQVGPRSSGHQCGVLTFPLPRKRTVRRLVSSKRASSSRRWVAGVPPLVPRLAAAPGREFELEGLS